MLFVAGAPLGCRPVVAPGQPLHCMFSLSFVCERVFVPLPAHG